MKHLKFLSVLFIVLFLNFGCSTKSADFINTTDNDESAGKIIAPEKLSPREYVAWVEDKNNGLKVEKEIEEFTYLLQYKPFEYVALMELKKETVGSLELNKKIEEYDGLQYYTFRISTDSRMELLKKNLNEANDYYGRIQYFSFDMQKDLKLIEGKDTLDCVLFHFERVYGLAPYATFVLGFPLTEGTNNKTLFYDEQIFGAGKIFLTVQSKNCKKLPSVITS